MQCRSPAVELAIRVLRCGVPPSAVRIILKKVRGCNRSRASVLVKLGSLAIEAGHCSGGEPLSLSPHVLAISKPSTVCGPVTMLAISCLAAGLSSSMTRRVVRAVRRYSHPRAHEVTLRALFRVRAPILPLMVFFENLTI